MESGAGGDDDRTHLSLAARELTEIPAHLAEEKGAFVQHLDLTDNNIVNVTHLDKFVALHTLVLDKNQISDLKQFPTIRQLDTLWINNNKLTDLTKTMDVVCQKFPKLTYLSMLRNPCVPDMYWSEEEAEAYQRYRYYVVHRMPGLKFLDATAVSETELKESQRVGKFLKIARPDPSQYQQRDPSGANNPTAPLEREAAFQPEHFSHTSFIGSGRARYDGRQSEGNRFIVDSDL